MASTVLPALIISCVKMYLWAGTGQMAFVCTVSVCDAAREKWEIAARMGVNKARIIEKLGG